MGILYRTTRPVQGDDFNVLLAKLLQRLGGQPQSGDSEVLILRRILELLSGFTPPPDSTAHELVRKILEALHVVEPCEANMPGLGGIVWGPDSTEIIFPDSGISFEDSIFDVPGITSLTLNNLVLLSDDGNNNGIEVYMANTVVAYSFPDLEEADVAYIDGSNNQSISSWSSPNLRNVRGDFLLYNNPITFLDITSLEEVGGVLEVAEYLLITEANYDSLVTVGSDFYAAAACPNLTSINAPLIESAYSLYLYECPLLPSAAFPSLTELTGNDASIFDNDTLTSLSFPLLETSFGLSVVDNPMLTTLDLPSYIPTDGETFTLTGNALSAASVNAFLARCIANAGFVTGTVDLSGGTNAAPTGQGIADKNDLIARGVSVTTN